MNHTQRIKDLLPDPQETARSVQEQAAALSWYTIQHRTGTRGPWLRMALKFPTRKEAEMVQAERKYAYPDETFRVVRITETVEVAQ